MTGSRQQTTAIKDEVVNAQQIVSGNLLLIFNFCYYGTLKIIISFSYEHSKRPSGTYNAGKQAFQLFALS